MMLLKTTNAIIPTASKPNPELHNSHLLRK
jgi:hypothetical protein